MKIKASGIINKKEAVNLIKNGSSKNPIIFASYAILGICIGTVCETINSDVYATLSAYFDDFFSTLSSVSFLRLAVNSGAYNMIFIFISMLLGLCAAGSIFLYALPFVKGLGIGCVCSFIYSEYALKGVLYCSLIVFLPALVQLISILLACSESRLMSGDILRLIDKKETENEEISVKFYILRYLIIILFIAFSGIIYSLLCRVLALII